LRRLLREPLLHFAVLGALLFAGYGLVGSDRVAPDEIVVTPEQVESLSSTFERTWLRPPTEAELAERVQAWVREEVFYREGLALGLDRDDPVVRNRIRTKMEFLADETAAAEPSEAELQAWLSEHAADYALPDRISFEQQGGAALLPAAMSAATPAEITSVFGPEFADALAGLEPGAWSESVRSAYGVHRVRILEKRAGRRASLEEVRDEVARDLERSRATESQERLYRSLLARYRVRIESLAPVPASRDLADAR
jgi:hypothetical protein